MYIVQSCGNNDVPCTYKLTFKVREKKEILIEVMYQEAIKFWSYISFLLHIKVKVGYFLLVSMEATAAITVPNINKQLLFMFTTSHFSTFDFWLHEMLTAMLQ